MTPTARRCLPRALSRRQNRSRKERLNGTILGFGGVLAPISGYGFPEARRAGCWVCAGPQMSFRREECCCCWRILRRNSLCQKNPLREERWSLLSAVSSRCAMLMSGCTICAISSRMRSARWTMVCWWLMPWDRWQWPTPELPSILARRTRFPWLAWMPKHY